MLDDLPDLGALGTRKAPTEWVAVDSDHAPPPKPKRRMKKVLKREAVKAIAAALSQHSSPNNKRTLSKEELQELSRKALEATYQRVKLKKEPRDPTLACLSRENEEGNVEYKLRLKEVEGGNPYRIQQLITQMKYRLTEGNGECFYYIGVEDDGYPKGLELPDLQASLSTLQFMAAALGASSQLLQHIPGAAGRTCALARVRRETPEQVAFMDLRVAVSGGVDSGKSSLVAVLSHGSNGAPALDNGRGSARMSVLRHKHELESGRTSSISQQVLGYNADGEVLNYAGVSTLTPAEISCGAAHLLTFIDMGGHERCLKTCLWGMTCLLPDYAVLCICAAGGLGRMSKEHLAVAVALEVPVAVVLTKCDLVDAARVEAVLGQVRALLSLALPGMRPDDGEQAQQDMEVVAPLIETGEAAQEAAQVLCHMRAAGSLAERQRVSVPIFATSAVSGMGLQLLHSFLRELQPAAVLREAQEQEGQGLEVLSQACTAEATAAATVSAEEALCRSGGSNSLQRVGQQEHHGCLQDADAFVVTAAPGEGSVLEKVVASQGVEPAVEPVSALGAAITPGLRDSAAHDAPIMFQVDQTLDLHRVGSVVCGTVVQGVIRVGTTLLLGPDEAGGFMPVLISGMQRLHTPVAQVRAGQTAALALTPLMAPGLGASALGGDTAALPGMDVGLGLAVCDGGVVAAGVNDDVASQPGSHTPFQPIAACRVDNTSIAQLGAHSSASVKHMQPAAQDADEDLFACLGAFDEDIADGSVVEQGGQDAAMDDDLLAAMGTFDSLSHSPLQEQGPTLGLAVAIEQEATNPMSTLQPSLVSGQVAVQEDDGDMGGLFAALGLCDGTDLDTASELPLGASGPVAQEQCGEDDAFAGLGAFDGPDAQAASASDSRHAVARRGEPTSCAEDGILAALEAYRARCPAPAQCGSSTHGSVRRRRGRGKGEPRVRAGECATFGAGLDADDGGFQLHRVTRGAIHTSRPSSAVGAEGGCGGGRDAMAHDGVVADGGDTGVGTEDWQRLCELATSPPAPSFLPQAISPPNSRKGAVLLDANFLAAPGSATAWEFEAVVVLLGGRWPARGLISGRWPPLCDEPPVVAPAACLQPLPQSSGAGASGASAGVSGASDSDTGATTDQQLSPQWGRRRWHGQAVPAVPGTSAPAAIDGNLGARVCPGTGLDASPRLGRRHTRHASTGVIGSSGEHVVVLHCGSVRQAASVVWMQELHITNESTPSELDPVKYRAIRATAAILHHDIHKPPMPGVGSVLLGAGVEAGAGGGSRRAGASASGSGQSQASVSGASRSGSCSDEGDRDSPHAHAGRREDLGCVVRMRFRFISRPEWVRQGARLIIRDRSDGHIAGAGFLDKLN